MSRSAPRRQIRLADIVGAQVIDAEGQKIGRVVDLILDPEDGYRVVALEVGTVAWIHRLHVVGDIRRRREARDEPRIDWEHVVSFKHNRITLDIDMEVAPATTHK